MKWIQHHHIYWFLRAENPFYIQEFLMSWQSVKIEEYILNINKLHVVYDSETTNLFYAYRRRFIDSLFDCLVWCIKNKYIAL